jgi:enoyl-CoA hydratase
MRAVPGLRLDVSERVALLTIARPEVRNALTGEMVAAMRELLAGIAVREDVGVLIVTGEGTRAFAAGADIRQLRERRAVDALAGGASALFSAVERLPQATIAAINGDALGGGCELALACDLRVAAEHARFGQPEVGLGVVPAAGATQRLPRLIGFGRATQMVLTGDPIDAGTALQWGLVSAVVPAADVVPAARRFADRILARGPRAVRLAKLALAASSRVDLDSGLLIESLAQAICFESAEKAEGTTAFLEKRRASFRG